jgi:hypothetical protein
VVVSLSSVSNRLWGDRAEKLPAPRQWVIREDRSVAEFGQVNAPANPTVEHMFGR